MRAKSPIEERILALAEPVADDLGFNVVRVRMTGGSGKKTLQIMAERKSDGEMSADDCAILSRAMSAVLDVDDPFAGEWVLEVSSPGIDRPLTRSDDFERWKGFLARIELDRMVEGKKRFRGELAGVDADGVLLNTEDEPDNSVAIPFDWISEAKLLITDELIAESLKRRGGPEEDGGDAAQKENHE